MRLSPRYGSGSYRAVAADGVPPASVQTSTQTSTEIPEYRGNERETDILTKKKLTNDEILRKARTIRTDQNNQIKILLDQKQLHRQGEKVIKFLVERIGKAEMAERGEAETEDASYALLMLSRNYSKKMLSDTSLLSTLLKFLDSNATINARFDATGALLNLIRSGEKIDEQQQSNVSKKTLNSHPKRRQYYYHYPLPARDAGALFSQTNGQSRANPQLGRSQTLKLAG